MKLHRFYVNPKDTELGEKLWLKDERLRHQWQKVLRFRPGDELVLFDGERVERLYRIERIEPDAIELMRVTDFDRKLPQRHVYLFFSLLKKDKNDWIIQKCTEIGVRNFVPILAHRSEKTGFNLERAEKILVEAAEQCGRGDIPKAREPLALSTALDEYKDKLKLLVCDENLAVPKTSATADNPIGIFIGPEGGWTEDEIKELTAAGADPMRLGNLTLRAETAAVTAAGKLL